MAILIFLKGQKQPLILRETTEAFRRAIEAEYKTRMEGKPPTVTEFKGWHNKPMWVNDILTAIDYATVESDKEIQESQNEAKKREYEMKKAMEKAAATGQGPGGRILNIPGYPGPGRGGQG